MEEIEELTDLDARYIRKAIRVGVRKGVVKRTTKVMEQMNGALKRVPSYVFLKGKK